MKVLNRKSQIANRKSQITSALETSTASTSGYGTQRKADNIYFHNIYFLSGNVFLVDLAIRAFCVHLGACVLVWQGGQAKNPQCARHGGGSVH